MYSVHGPGAAAEARPPSLSPVIAALAASTLRPTIAYGLGEARGDVASGSAGGYTGLEFNYNPISNNLGTSVSSGTAASGNLFGAEELLPGSNSEGLEGRGLLAWACLEGHPCCPRHGWGLLASSGRTTDVWPTHLPPRGGLIKPAEHCACWHLAHPHEPTVATPNSAGLSGVEFIGTADDQTRLGKARTAQMGQAIAYPFNVLNPVNPLTCAQVSDVHMRSRGAHASGP